MTRTNMSLATIAGLWKDEKPLYLDTTEAGQPKRHRIYGVRMWYGKFQVKLKIGSEWQEADHKQVVCAY